ncbi:Ran binding protein 1, putative, variant 2 [Balamuthia mandrillaris]
MSLAATISAVFCLQDDCSEFIGGSCFLAPIIGILAVQPTLGRTFITVTLIISGMLSGALSGFLITISMHNTSPVLLCFMLFLSSLCLCYLDKQAVWKKLAFILNIVIILSAVTAKQQLDNEDEGDSHLDTSTILSLTLLPCLSTAIGLLGSVVASMVPWPSMAQKDLYHGLKTNAILAAKLFDTLLKLFCTPSTPRRDMKRIHLRVKADLLMNTLAKNIELLNTRLEGAHWEKPWMRSIGHQQYLEHSRLLMESMEGMRKAVRALLYGDVYLSFVSRMQKSIYELGACSLVYMANVGRKLQGKKPKTKYIYTWDEGREKKQNEEHESVKATDKLEGEKKEKEKEKDDDSKEENEKKEEKTDEVGLEFAREQLQQALKKVRKKYFKARAQTFYAAEQQYWPLEDTLPLHALVFTLELFVEQMLQTEKIQIRWEWHLWTFFKFVVLSPFSWANDLIIQLVIEPCHHLWHIRKGWSALRQEFRQARHSRRLIGSFQMAAAMTLASIVVFIPSLRDEFPRGSWAPLTVALVMERSKFAGSFVQSIHRLQGTVAGAMFGYFALLFATTNEYAIIACLFFWVIVAGYVRSDKMYSYTGFVAAFTPAVIMFVAKYDIANAAPSDTADENTIIQDIALSRIQLTFFAVLIILAINFIWQARAAQSLEDRLLEDTLHSLCGCVDFMLGSIVGEQKYSVRGEHVLKLEAAIKTALDAQMVAVSEATIEPQLWRPAFPTEAYDSICNSQKKIYKSCVLMDRALHAAHRRPQGIFPLFIEPLEGPISHLRNEVIGSLNDMMVKLRELFRRQKRRIFRAASSSSLSSQRVSYVPLSITNSLKSCENEMVRITLNLTRTHFRMSPRRQQKLPLAATTDVVTFHQLIFALREFVGEMNNLWEGICLLVQVTSLSRK